MPSGGGQPVRAAWSRGYSDDARTENATADCVAERGCDGRDQWDLFDDPDYARCAEDWAQPRDCLDGHVDDGSIAAPAAALRRGFQNVSGVSDLQVLPKAAKVRVTFDAAVTNGEAIAAHLREIGFPPQPLRSTSSLPRPWQNPKVLMSAGSGVLLLIGWLVNRGVVRRDGHSILYCSSNII